MLRPVHKLWRVWVQKNINRAQVVQKHGFVHTPTKQYTALILFCTRPIPRLFHSNNHPINSSNFTVIRSIHTAYKNNYLIYKGVHI
jgi:hypothetical protein